MRDTLNVAPDLTRCRADFPLLKREIDGTRVIYFDSAATSLRPQPVIDAVVRFYSEYNANVHRAVHRLSEEATDAFEGARTRIARFIGAESREIAFVRHATEALNLVARSLPESASVAVCDAEHHSNLLPWRKGRILRLPTDQTGAIDLEHTQRIIEAHSPALVSLSAIGNALGTRQPVSELTQMAHAAGAAVLLDVSQAIGHEPLHVKELECDYLCFSGHKMLGPGGVGVLYARGGKETQLVPLLHGGSMVLNVSLDDCELQPFPWCLEAGTPNIEGVIGLAAACEYLDKVGLENIQAHNRSLTRVLRAGLEQIERFKIHSPADPLGSAITSFSFAGMPAHGVSRLLSNRYAIMVRSGYHCAQPLHEVTGLPETVRASVHLYNSMDEIERCLEACATIARMP